MDKITVSGKIQDGKIKITNKSTLDKWTSLLNEDDEVEVTFLSKKDLKTYQQIKLVYKCIRVIAEKTGYTLREAKILMKKQLGWCYEHNLQGERIIECESLADMSKQEISNFIVGMDNWSIEHLNSPLLDYNDLNFLKLL